MAYYRSSFNAQDERAKFIQKYIDGFTNKDLTTQEIFNLVDMGNSVLRDTTLSTNYDKIQEKLVEALHNKEKERGRPYSKRTYAKRILDLQMEYITKAGVFGRPALRVVSPDAEEGKAEEILEILEKDTYEDGTTDEEEL